jgi:hypothetical protein
MKLGIGTKVEHPKFGAGVIVGNEEEEVYEIYFRQDSQEREISKGFDGLVIVTLREQDPDSVSFEDIKKALHEIVEPLVAPTEEVELGERWNGGKLIIEPGVEGLQSKEIPIETFFHKIVMTRDRLRVMEQKINSSALDDTSKVELQQYISRIYGSLTTFNILFAQKDDHFKGTGGN